MARWHYRAVSASGELVSGVLDAASAEAAVERLRAGGQMPLEARPAAGERWWDRPVLSPGPRPRDVALAVSELAALIRAQLPLDRALEILVGLTEDRRLRAALAEVLDRVRGGAALADAMAARPAAFGPLHVGMVRAGEAAGALDDALSRLADFLGKAQELRDAIASALVYPVVLLVVAAGSVALMLTVVLPQFEPLFAEAGPALPVATRAVMAAAEGVRAHGAAALAGLAALGLLLRLRLRDPGFAARWDAALLRLPLAGPLVRRTEAARFCRCLGSLVAGGVPLLRALELTRDTLGNAAVARAVEGVAAASREGGGIAGPLARAGVFPPVATQLVRVGEEAGRLEEMLLRAADVLDRDVRRRVDRMLALLVPLLTVGLGLVVAAIVGSVLVAILSVNSLAA